MKKLVLAAGLAVAIAASGAVFLGGKVGESPEILSCEGAILAGLRSPGGYERRDARAYDAEGKRMASVEYDAPNVYGTLVRERAFCRFAPSAEGPVLTSLLTGGSRPREIRGAELQMLLTRSQLAGSVSR